MTMQAFSGSASRGGARLIITSGVVFILLVFYTLGFATNFSAILAIAYIASAMGLFIGWAKLAEPPLSLLCESQGIRYQHRVGSLLLPWSAFSFCAVPSIEGKQLAFIGFKITNYDLLLQGLPVRLAVRMMTEQRALYLEAVRQSCSSGQCASDLLREKDSFKTQSGQYSGVKAIFAQRMQRLAQASGFELLVPVNVGAEQAEQWCRDINKNRLQQLQQLQPSN